MQLYLTWQKERSASPSGSVDVPMQFAVVHLRAHAISPLQTAQLDGQVGLPLPRSVFLNNRRLAFVFNQ